MIKNIYRPNVSYKRDRIAKAFLDRFLEKREEFNYISYIDEKDLEGLSDSTKQKIRNSNIRITKCIHCGKYVAVDFKTYQKYKGAFNYKFGGWSCHGCGMERYGHKIDGRTKSFKNFTEKSEILENIYLKKQKAEYEREGIKVTQLKSE